MIDSKLLSEKLQQILEERNIAGMSVAVTDREKVIYNEGFGVLSIEHPDMKQKGDTMCRIASVSKIVTSTMVMKLVEEGLLDLDKLVTDYIPDLELSRPEALKELTLRHLLTHTGGLPTDEGYIPNMLCREEDISAEIMKYMPGLKIATLPSEKVNRYANVGFVLAAEMGTRVTGKTVPQLWKDYVLDPLGMNMSTNDFYRAASYPLTQPHDYDENGNIFQVHYHRHHTMYVAGGGLYSTTPDLCKLGRFLLNYGKTDSGEQYLSRETMENMFTKHTIKDINPGDYYGLGIHIHAYKDRFFYGHSGNIHPYNTALFVDHVTGIGVAVFINCPHGDLRFLIPEMIIEMAEK